ncbi:GDSL esterase/lipase [Thalictrum thalictroides]|uniref:GDSL esterase/lipase n=1 Tax=Thalictrum thalictroides TaxID=46969 RepID=A0A7J6WI80_THATH|nr:GDSL esterase/lipase [Thalictrum thalictroides]
MVLKVSFLYIITLFFLLWFLGESTDFSSPAIFNFGDSNSDTGGLAAGVAYPLGLPNGETHFHKPSGRLCDGRLIIDFLMNSLELPFLNPYLDSIGAPSFQNGCNFATGGSTILPANAASISPFSFGIQVSQFLRFKARVLEILDEGTKATKFLPQKEYFALGLYAIDIGQNDLDGAFSIKSEEQVVALIPTILSELEAGIQKLYDEGARRYWIHNTGPLGCLPRIIARFGNDTLKVDEFSCINSHNRVAKLFNLQLHTLCKKFQEQYPDINVTYVDIFGIKLNLIANYSEYGFKQPIAACCGFGGLPLNYDKRIACGQTKILNGSTVTANPCDDPKEYINWDGNHYTEAANFHVSSQILAGNYPSTFSSVILPVTLASSLEKTEVSIV